MSGVGRTIFSVAVILLTVIAAAVWGVSFYFDSRDDAERAAADFSACQVSAERLNAARSANHATGAGSIATQLPSRRTGG